MTDIGTVLSIVIEEDNQTWLDQLKKDGLLKSIKQMDAKYELVTNYVRKWDVQLDFVPSEDMVANTMTTNLVAQMLSALQDLFGIRSIIFIEEGVETRRGK